jgi:hypothetical protein
VEQRLAIARLIWNFDLVNADDAHEWESEDNMKNMKAYSTWQKPGLRVRAIDRDMEQSKYWQRRSKEAARTFSD